MKILFFTDSPILSTGMGRVAYNLGRYFKSTQGIDIAFLGWHHNYPQFDRIRTSLDWKIYPSEKLSLAQDNAKEKELFKKAVEDYKPDLLITLGDMWDFNYVVDSYEAYSFKWLAYYNIESEPLGYEYVRKFTAPTHLCVTSEFGKESILKLDSSLNPKVVWHGYDPNVFNWLNIPETGRKLYADQERTAMIANLENKFVILMDNQNTNRKNYPKAIESYAKFCQDKQDTMLLMVCNPVNETNFNLTKFLRLNFDLGREKILILETNHQAGSWIPDSYMNFIYNISNAYLSTSRTEGFGLSLLQAMATKTVPIATDFSSHRELLKDGRGFLAKVAEYDYGPEGMKTALINSDDCANILQGLYNDWQAGSYAANSVHQKGLEFAADNTWENSYFKLLENVEQCMDKKKKLFYPNDPYVTYYPDLRVAGVKAVRARETKAPTIGAIVMGGLGDNIQAIPVIKGLHRKYPESNLFLVCEGNSGIFYDWLAKPVIHPYLSTGEAKISFAGALKSLHDAFDYFYDIRYVSKVYAKEGSPDVPEDTVVFYNQWKSFYHKWPWGNNLVHKIGKLIVDIRLLSCGLQEYASSDDMKIPVKPIDLPSSKYVSIHNSAGNIGKLKLLNPVEIKKVVDYLQKQGYYILQTGSINDELMPGVTDLRGRTDYWETGYILQNATIHIGPEGALYHMAKAVGGRSLVWLSATHPEPFVYDNTIVLPYKETSKFKCDPCWWKGQDWVSGTCIQGREYCENLPSGEDIISALEANGI